MNLNLTKQTFDMKYEIEKSEIQVFGLPQEILKLSLHQSQPSLAIITAISHSTNENT